MKKFFKVLIIILVAVVLIAGCFALFLSVRGIPNYEAVDPGIKIVSDSARIERGRILANMLCADCHKNPETGKLTGANMDPLGKLPFGKLMSQNITQDKTVGIGNWTDGEIVYLLRTGIKKDGQYSPPWMAKLPHMSDEDVASIISFLRSDDVMVNADATPDIPCEPSFFAKFLCLVAFKPLPYPDKVIEQPDTSNKIDWGKYLVWNLDCFTCHSADFAKLNSMEPQLSAGYLGGGNFMDSLFTPNITPDKETGIGMWTEEKFINSLRYGIKPGGGVNRMPMKPYNLLSESECKAIYAYLQTVPPIKNAVSRNAVY